MLQPVDEDEAAAGRVSSGMGVSPAVAAAVAARFRGLSAPETRADGRVLDESYENVVLALASTGRPLLRGGRQADGPPVGGADADQAEAAGQAGVADRGSGRPVRDRARGRGSAGLDCG